jgi:hypothetical protein
MFTKTVADIFNLATLQAPVRPTADDEDGLLVYLPPTRCSLILRNPGDNNGDCYNLLLLPLHLFLLSHTLSLSLSLQSVSAAIKPSRLPPLVVTLIETKAAFARPPPSDQFSFSDGSY